MKAKCLNNKIVTKEGLFSKEVTRLYNDNLILNQEYHVLFQSRAHGVKECMVLFDFENKLYIKVEIDFFLNNFEVIN